MMLLRYPGLILAAASLLATSGCTEGQDGRSLPAEGVIALSDQFTAEFALIDQDGRLMRNSDLKGRVAVIYFGFATCPDVCPLALGRLSAALNELSAKEQRKVIPLFITVDPERDTPEVLKAYLARDERITGLTGDRASVEKTLAGFKVFAEAQPIENSSLGYTMQHSSFFYLVDRRGKPLTALEDTLEPAAIAAAIRRTLRG